MSTLPSLELQPQRKAIPKQPSFESEPSIAIVDGPVLPLRFEEEPANQPELNPIFANPILISAFPVIILYLIALVYLRKSVMYSYEKALWSIVVILFPIVGPLFLLVIQPKTPGAYSAPSKGS